MPAALSKAAVLARVRKICLGFPETSERESHGAPTFFVRGGKSSFAMFLDDHHGDGKLGVWCAAPAGAQAVMVENDPEVFYVPAYVGYLGWVGMRLDRGASWDLVAEVLGQAYETRLAKAAGKRRRLSG